MIAIGNVETIHMFVGTHEVNKVYLGDTQIYPKIPKRLIFDPSSPYTTDYTAKSFIVNVDTDLRYWFVNVDAGSAFCSVEKINNSSFRVTVTQNLEHASKTAQIGIYTTPYERVSFFKLIQQEESRTFSVSPTSESVNHLDHDLFIYITQSGYPDWYIAKNGDETWYNISKITGDRIQLEIEENDDTEQRTASFSIYKEIGATPITFQITQEGISVKEEVVITAEYQFWNNNFALISNKTTTTAFTLNGNITYNHYSQIGKISVPFTKNIPIGFTSGALDVEIPKDAYNIDVEVETITTATQIIYVETINTAFSIFPPPPVNVGKEGDVITLSTRKQGNITDFTPYLYGGQGFCTVSKNNDNIIISVSENTDASDRSDIIGVRVVVNGVQREFTTFYVNQSAGDVQFSAVFNKPTTNLPAAGDNGTFTVVSNVPWHTRLISGSGVTTDDENKTWTISENTSSDNRNAAIVFINDNDDTVLHTQHFSQLGSVPVFSVRFIDITLESLDSDTHNGYAEVTSNIPWKVESDEDWITLDDEPARYDVGIWISANTSVARSGHIIFKNLYTDEVLYTKTVNQSAYVPPTPPVTDINLKAEFTPDGTQIEVYCEPSRNGVGDELSVEVQFTRSGVTQQTTVTIPLSYDRGANPVIGDSDAGAATHSCSPSSDDYYIYHCDDD